MMQKKKLKLLTVFLATISAAVFIPLTANAEYQRHDISTGDCIIDENSCTAVPCDGHEIIGLTDKYHIYVGSGTHTIILNGAEIRLTKSDDDDANETISPIDIGDDASVELKLAAGTTNTLEGGPAAAGIRVPINAKLKIMNQEETDGTLTVTGGSGGAGIGTDGFFAPAGSITIESGIINAAGGSECAGIGGGAGGHGTSIIINGGTVNATGGLNASGIGCGSGTSDEGTVIITGGSVTARGGNSNTPPYKPNGIDCYELSSKVGLIDSSVTLNVQPSLSATVLGNFNGIIWNGDEGYVYGSATLEQDIRKEQTLEIPSGASLFIPDYIIGPDGQKKKPSNAGLIIGTGSILNANNLANRGGKIDGPSLKVVLSSADIVVNTPLTYNGSDLTNKAITKNPTRTIGNTEYIVDDSGWELTIRYRKNDKTVDKIIDAGGYIATYKKNGYNTISLPAIQVNAKDLTPGMIGEIRDQEYNWGLDIKPTPEVKDGAKKLTAGTDFRFEYEDNRDVGTATLRIVGAGNNYKVPDDSPEGVSKTFEIVPVSLEKAAVTLGGVDNAVYDGKEKKPDITVTLKKKTAPADPNDPIEETDEPLIEGSDYEVKFSREDFTEEDDKDDLLVSAGTVTVTIKALEKTDENEKVNYSGEQKLTFNIAKYPLTIKEVTAANRQYDGSKYVAIKDVKFNESLFRNDEVGIKSKALLTVPADSDNPDGEVKAADVGTYTEISFDVDPIELSGKHGRNYEVKPLPDGPFNLENKGLTDKIEISQRIPDSPIDVEGKPSVTTDETKFNYTIEFEPEDGVEYLFGMDNESAEAVWREGGTPVTAEDGTKKMQFTYEDIEPGTKHLFHIHSKETKNVKGVTVGSIEYDFKQIERPEDHIPQKVELQFELNDDKTTFTATIVPTPATAGLEYSFDGTTFSSAEGANRITDCKPTKDYTGYVRYPETDVYKAGKAVSVTAAAPKVEELEKITPNLEWIDKNAPDENLVPDSLRDNEELGNMEAIIAKMTRILSSIPGYTYENMEFYDLTISIEKIHSDGTVEPITDLTEYFRKGGIKVTVPYPAGTSKETNDFAVAHMFSAQTGRFNPGDVETPSVTKDDDGLTFTVQSTSPLAIAWKEASQNNPNGSDDPNGTDDPNGADPNGSDDPSDTDPNGLDPLAASGEDDGTGRNADGTGTDAGGDGTDADGTGTDANGADANAANGTTPSLLPKTGDTNKIIMWIAIAAACIVIIAVVRVRSKKADKSKGTKKPDNSGKTNTSSKTNKPNTSGKSKK